MSNVIDDIISTIHECHKRDTNVAKKKIECTSDSLESIECDVQTFLADTRSNMSSIEYASLNKMLAICNFKMGRDIKAVNHLIESHAVIFRQQTLHRCFKTEMRESVLKVPQKYGLKSEHIKFNIKDLKDNKTLKSMLTQLPEEWYIVQVTEQYKPFETRKHNKSLQRCMHPMHITILPTGRNANEPFCITVPKPLTYDAYDICNEIQKVQSTNKSDLEATYANNELYWKMRERQNVKMKNAVRDLEQTWLREWRLLFIADPLDNLKLVEEITQMIDKLISDSNVLSDICAPTRWLLKKVALGACFLQRREIERAVKYLLPKHRKIAKNIILSIYGKMSDMEVLRDAKRKNLLLIVDESMDYLPFESMEILQCHPVSRFPSLYITYALFKEHESTIRGGCKIIKVKDNLGTYIVNPSGNLHKMEKRMKIFIKYWLPQWNGLYNTEPAEDVFENALIDHDVLMYNGHGSGIQYLAGEHIEKLRVMATVLLFGCSSVKLLLIGGRYPPYGISNQYLIASSPCILGMLWEVTDADIDKMTADFISKWIPSSAGQPWSDVDLNAWCSGKLKFTKHSKKGTNISTMEPEMLRAVAKSKQACSQYMTAAAIVVRGLPVKVE